MLSRALRIVQLVTSIIDWWMCHFVWWVSDNCRQTCQRLFGIMRCAIHAVRLRGRDPQQSLMKVYYSHASGTRHTRVNRRTNTTTQMIITTGHPTGVGHVGLMNLSDEVFERVLRALLMCDGDCIKAVMCTCHNMHNLLSITKDGRLSWVTREAVSIHNCSVRALRVSISDRTSSSTVAEWGADTADEGISHDLPEFATAFVEQLSLKPERAWRVRVPNIDSMSCSSDGTSIALRCEDRVRIYHVPSGRCIHDFEWLPPITQLTLDQKGEWMLILGPLQEDSNRYPAWNDRDNAVLIHNGTLCATQRIQPPRDSVHTGGSQRLHVFGGWFYTDGGRSMLAILFASTKDWALVVYASEDDEWQRVECFGPFGSSRVHSYSASENGLIASVLTMDNHLHILERSDVYGWEKQDLIDIPDGSVDNMQLSSDGMYLLIATRNNLSILQRVEQAYVLTRRISMPLMHTPRFCFARHAPHVMIYNAWQCRHVDLISGTSKECAVDDSCRSITNIVWNEEGLCVATTDGVVRWHYKDTDSSCER